ncbi:MAG TPA: hypothetical protein IAB48_00725 [Candidatus Fimimorpha excrementavium]|nr:hypothetical protein [Candidatus Fimimorpha excrementavium]
MDWNKYEIFRNHITNLKETSLDESGGQKVYMTQSLRPAINFDGVKEDYIKNLELSEFPKSNDALMEEGDGTPVFVEFKNGFMDRAKQFGLRKKIYDSVLIFTDITSARISDMRKNMKYILVYNEGVNQTNNLDETLKKKQRNMVQPSVSFDSFAKKIGQYAKSEYICFGLTIFKNYCFKEVHTFTETEFEKYLSDL